MPLTSPLLGPASDLEPTRAAAVIEATLTASLLSFARLPGATLHDGPTGSWVDAGVPDATFNAVAAWRPRGSGPRPSTPRSPPSSPTSADGPDR